MKSFGYVPFWVVVAALVLTLSACGGQSAKPNANQMISKAYGYPETGCVANRLITGDGKIIQGTGKTIIGTGYICSDGDTAWINRNGEVAVSDTGMGG